MTKFIVLSNLHISCYELNDKYYISFVFLFKTLFYFYICISVIFKSVLSNLHISCYELNDKYNYISFVLLFKGGGRVV